MSAGTARFSRTCSAVVPPHARGGPSLAQLTPTRLDRPGLSNNRRQRRAVWLLPIRRQRCLSADAHAASGHDCLDQSGLSRSVMQHSHTRRNDVASLPTSDRADTTTYLPSAAHSVRFRFLSVCRRTPTQPSSASIAVHPSDELPHSRPTHTGPPVTYAEHSPPLCGPGLVVPFNATFAGVLPIFRFWVSNPIVSAIPVVPDTQ